MKNFFLISELTIVLLMSAISGLYAQYDSPDSESPGQWLASQIYTFRNYTSAETPEKFNEAGNDGKYSLKLLTTENKLISPLLLGFNAVYAYEADTIWGDGKIEQYLKDVNVTVMRYPGGTVSSFYHWNSLSGEGWKDCWDPKNPVTPKTKSDFMDLDEFIAVSKRINSTPLLGINMSSGRRWKRLEEGVKEALDLMKYCRDKKFKVRYWYLDNEPYQPDSNGGSKTIEEYAELINLFSVRMKEFDPEIKIIVNWQSAFKNKRDDYQKLLSIAGANIDIIDAHWYWSWSNPTFDKWLIKTPMTVWTGESYQAEIAYFRQMVKDFGYPDIKLASLEWNVGPIKQNQLNPHQCALIQSEMLMQFMIGGLDMATFWPLQGAGNAVSSRSFIRRGDRSAQPAYQTFEFLGKIQGSDLIKSEVIKSNPNILNIVAVDQTGDQIRVGILNKNGIKMNIEITSDLFGTRELIEAKAFVLNDQGNGSYNPVIKLITHNASEISFEAFETSLTMLTFKKR